jgi:hypothetical protein
MRCLRRQFTGIPLAVVCCFSGPGRAAPVLGLCFENDILKGKALAIIVQTQSGAKGEIDEHPLFQRMRHVADHRVAGSADAENNLRKFHLAMTPHKSPRFQRAPKSGLEGIRGLGRETVPDLN